MFLIMWKYLRVKELRFWDCNLDEAVLRDLAGLLSEKTNMIQSIEIEYDQMLNKNLILHRETLEESPVPGFCLTKFLQSCHKLKFLALYETKIEVLYINDFFRFWLENVEDPAINIEHIDLYGNHINNETLELLAQILEGYHKLTFIGLGKTGLNSDPATCRNILEIMKTLQFISCSEIKSSRGKEKKTKKAPVMKMINEVMLGCLNGEFETLDLRENEFSASFANELNSFYYEAPVGYQLVVALNKQPINFQVLAPND